MPHRTPALLSLAAIALSASVTPAHARPSTAYERQAVIAANDVRTAHGMRALRRTRCLAKLADTHARRMARHRVVFHQDLTRVQRVCRLRHAAENVAVGYRTGRITVHSGWMKSPGHRANILTRGHRVTAVGAARDGHGMWWTVQLLGRR